MQDKIEIAKMKEEYLFVYGTLRSEIEHPLNDLLSSTSLSMGKASYQGKLFQVNDYPGAIPSTNPVDKVYGEVYLLKDPDRILDKLDQYEETGPAFPQPAEYVREKVVVILESGKSIESWIFIYNWSVEGLERIESGDYCAGK